MSVYWARSSTIRLVIWSARGSHRYCHSLSCHGRGGIFSWDLVVELLPAAFTIAMLGCIESLLCAVVADGMTGTKHNPNAELVGQGLANMVVPFFGGIPATAAIARTATNIRAGAFSPISAIVHALFVLAAMIALAPMLSYVPMSALAGLLIMVAWNMSEAPHFVHTLKVAPRRDVAVLLTCFTLTVVFDMVVAVVVGLLLAGVLFIQRIASLTTVDKVTGGHPHQNFGEKVVVYDINGPLFFAASEKALSVIDYTAPETQAVVYWTSVMLPRLILPLFTPWKMPLTVFVTIQSICLVWRHISRKS